MSLTPEGIKARARDLGFDLCGLTRADRHPRLARLAGWIDEGHAGSMQYLARSVDERSDPRRVLPTARTVVSLACVYNIDRPYSTSMTAPGQAAISRYAWGDDYHVILRRRLTALVTWMAEEAGTGFEAFSCVDNGPVQERVFAEQAGLGWIGKNTCLINPSLGSWLFLCEVLTNVELAPDAPAVDQCGSCTRCLEACPTGAIIAPYTVDATRCLSYLTIETRGAVDLPLRPAMGQHVFGCDICQDVCPWNRRAAVSVDPCWQPRDLLAFPRLVDLCTLPDDAWHRLLAGSALEYAGLKRIRRSLAYACAGLPAAQASAALDALAGHPSGQSPEVADAIGWARSSALGGC